MTTPTKNKIDLVLIDNDLLNHMTWKLWAESCQLYIETYYEVDEFFASASAIDKDLPIFLDYNLGDKKTATRFIPEIQKLGFKNIIITSGHKDIDADKISGSIALIGKDPEEALCFIRGAPAPLPF